ETYCISGVNGAGKTTLCYILLGLYESNDSIFYDGISIGQLNVSETRKRNIYIVPQKPYVPDTLVEFYLRDRLQQTNKYNLSDLHRLSVERHVPLNLYNEVCAHFDENCRNLSGGEFKKLNLFIGLLSSASILILDEPTNDLDQESIILIRNYVRNNPLNKMIIIVTHEKELEAACSHSVLLS
ncbi:MAG: ATP-binding cassette domain-containing protein, partial [Mogibacterium diversum]|nr:ATP-binding cassette domain-containing protein [Mogibacterium diversum]